MDMWEFFDILRASGRQFVEITEVYKLQHFDAMFESGVFIDKFEEMACPRNDFESYHYLEYYNISETHVTCLNFQGSASLLIKVLEEYKDKFHQPGNDRVILIAHAETALHDFFGDEEYWRARRSMRFNQYLQSIGNAYRMDFLGSTDEKDQVQRPDSWLDEKVSRLKGSVHERNLYVHFNFVSNYLLSKLFSITFFSPSILDSFCERNLISNYAIEF